MPISHAHGHITCNIESITSSHVTYDTGLVLSMSVWLHKYACLMSYMSFMSYSRLQLYLRRVLCLNMCVMLCLNRDAVGGGASSRLVSDHYWLFVGLTG